MALSPIETWSRLLDRARLELPEQTFRTWLEPTKALRIEGSTIVVGAPDRLAAEWNESKYSDLLASFAPVALGYPVAVSFTVHDERKARPQMDFFIAPPPLKTSPINSTQAFTHSSPLSERYTFANFVIGKSNELAAAAASAVAEAPGKVYNPLFIYGDTGLGKTHLMQAIGHSILLQRPATRVIFIGSEQFTNDLVASIQGRSTSDFRRRYRETDLLLVDDIHFLRGKEATQEEFFHTFNALYEAGRQIVLTSDRPASEIPGLEARLVTRFQWGMVADIELPDLEHRIAILRNKARLDHLELTIPEDVIRFIAEHIRSSIRELEGSVIRLLAYASLKRKEITLDLAKEALRDKVGLSQVELPSSDLTLGRVQQVVAEEWGISTEALRSKVRTKNLTIPRQVAMYLIRDLLGTQLIEIGQAFGGRDHSTVIHSLEKVKATLADDKHFRQRVEAVVARLSIQRQH